MSGIFLSNIATLCLYKDTLGFEVKKIEAKYYIDREDGCSIDLLYHII